MSEIQNKLDLIRLHSDNLEMMLASSASQPSDNSPIVLNFSPGVRLGIDAWKVSSPLVLAKNEEKFARNSQLVS